MKSHASSVRRVSGTTSMAENTADRAMVMFDLAGPVPVMARADDPAAEVQDGIEVDDARRRLATTMPSRKKITATITVTNSSKNPSTQRWMIQNRHMSTTVKCVVPVKNIAGR